MRFVKMHGLGNDYVFVDLFRETLHKEPARLAVEISRPHFGVGADGLILIGPSRVADAAMRIFNADGSEAAMCGNGIRCVGRYLYDTGRVRGHEASIETLSGVRRLQLNMVKGLCVGATVDMGVPVYDEKLITLSAQGLLWPLRRVSMGNPHGVCFCEEWPQEELFRKAGAQLERDEAFKDRANIEFCRLVGQDEIEVKVWERGSGPTLACGTGACAALVAGHLLGLTGRQCKVHLPGGTLDICWQQDGRVMMTGPAVKSFEGFWPD